MGDIVSPVYASAQATPLVYNAEQGIMPSEAGGSSRSMSLAVVGTVGLVGASMVFMVGETLDMCVVLNPESSAFDIGMSVLSLGVSVVTAGASPNYGAYSMGVRALTEGAAGIAGPAGRLVALDSMAVRQLATLRGSGVVSAADTLMVGPNVATELARQGINSSDLLAAGIHIADQSPIGAAVAATRMSEVLGGLGGPGAKSAHADALNVAEAVGLGADAFITLDTQVLRAFGGYTILPGTGGAAMTILGF